MCDKTECIQKIRDVSSYLIDNYNIHSLTLFGSTARESNSKESDVDLFVDMPPQGLKFVGLKLYLETLLNNKVDLVRNHSNIDPFFIKEINRDGIRII